MAAGPQHEVAVIGAGFSGIGTAIRLKGAGIEDFVILEQAEEVGGTWRDNTYPGVAVDVSSFVYSFSFEPNPDWSRAFAPGAEVQAYALHCVERYGLRPHIRFGTEVERLVFDEDAHMWRIATAGGEEISARHVVSAPGILARPKPPDIPGIEEFAGKVMHTARWDHDHDLGGERVGFIGTGATAVQAVPATARVAARLDVYQRTPIWIAPKLNPRIPPYMRALFRRVPLTQAAARLVVAGITEVAMVLAVAHNRELPLLVRAIERLCLRHLRRQVPDPELRQRLTPPYGFGCKRPSVSNSYLRAFTRDNVELVTDEIERVTPAGIRTADGREREIDTLILGTGFKVAERGNLPPYEVVGTGGRELGAFWDTERYQAYQGVTVPGFPNFFSIFGPYGFTGSNYFNLIEIQSMHVLRCLEAARNRDATRVEVRQKPHDRYFAEVQRRRRSQVFFNNDCGASHSYYFDRHGDVPLARPSTTPEAWLRARFLPLRHYRFDSAPDRAV